METIPRFKVSSERLGKPGIEPTTPDLQGELLDHYTTEASKQIDSRKNKLSLPQPRQPLKFTFEYLTTDNRQYKVNLNNIK